MNYMTLDDLIEFLTDAREKGLGGETVVVVKHRHDGMDRIKASGIRSARVGKADMASNRSKVFEVFRGGVEVLTIS